MEHDALHHFGTMMLRFGVALAVAELLPLQARASGQMGSLGDDPYSQAVILQIPVSMSNLYTVPTPNCS